MKALTLLQPHASLVVMNQKRIETRSWDTKYRGTLLIHSSKGRKKALRSLVHTPKFCEIMFSDSLTLYQAYDVLPFGFVIGQVDLIDTMPTELLLMETVAKDKGFLHRGGHCWHVTDHELAFGDYSPGRYAWLMSNIIKYDKPIPARGSLGLWNFTKSPTEPEYWCNSFLKSRMDKIHFGYRDHPAVPVHKPELFTH